jgi:hypothetical protein
VVSPDADQMVYATGSYLHLVCQGRRWKNNPATNGAVTCTASEAIQRHSVFRSRLILCGTIMSEEIANGTSCHAGVCKTLASGSLGGFEMKNRSQGRGHGY